MDVSEAHSQYITIKSSIWDNPEYSSILSKTQYMIKTGGYENLFPLFQLALCMPLDNAACERGFSVIMNDIKTFKGNKLDKPLFPLMLIEIYKGFQFDYATLGAKIAATWTPARLDYNKILLVNLFLIEIR